MSELFSKTTDPHWFKDAIIYELHIKAFHDSNADGLGDLDGLIQKLDYLQDLGVTAIWLLPFYPSPQRDGGYDISDYYGVHPDYGTVKQLRRLIKKAHQRGLRVITELVINHTSDQHPWFQRARRADPGSTHRNYYVWSDTTDRYKDVRIIFQDFESSNWTWDPVAQGYYWHRFYSHQPDLNYDNPAVQEEIFRIIDFWIDMGVDGFRLDAIPYLFERDGTNCENLPETHAFLKKLRTHVDRKKEDILLLAEANMWPEDSAAYFGDGDECHMNYHFPIMPRMFMALKMEDRYPIIDIIDQTPAIPDNCQWALFLRNHDELTLEMVTDEERDYMYRAYNKDALSRINLGIRHRLAPLLDNNRQKIELMNSLLFSLPGTPLIYYGDEIGMGDNVHLGDRDGVRTPMQWSFDRNAGFSRAHPQELFLPLITDPEYHFTTVNVETQQNNPSSLLWWMKRMIAIRKRFKAFGRGDIRFLSPENAKVLAFTRRFNDEFLLILTNLSRHPQFVEVELPDFENHTPIEVFGQTEFPPIKKGPNRFTLGPYGYYWFVLKPEHATATNRKTLVEVNWEPDRWIQLVKSKEKNGNPLGDKILPPFLDHNERYIHDDRTLEKVVIEEALPVRYPEGEALLLIIKTTFTTGFPARHFLPLCCETGMTVDNPESPPVDRILATLKGANSQGYLYEATENPAFRNYLFQQLLSGSGRKNQDGFKFVSKLKKRRAEGLPSLSHRILKTNGTNYSVALGELYSLKIFRFLGEALNPDLEINRFGGEKGLPVPGYLGHFEYRNPKGKGYTLGLLQPYVANQGTAWNYFFDVARRYLERVEAFPAEISWPPSWDIGLPPTPEWQSLIGNMPLERAKLLGETLAHFHTGLIDAAEPAFSPEGFSLHYQRSLYSGLQSLVRATFQQLHKRQHDLPGAASLLAQQDALLKQLRQIYQHKIDTPKTRIHGDLHLEKVLFTGKEFFLYDFEDERFRSYSETRLKKSPLRDVASLLCSLYYAALYALESHGGAENFLQSNLLPWVEVWFEGIKASLLGGYQPKPLAAGIIPQPAADQQILLDTFMVERHLHELYDELRHDRGRERFPLRGLSKFVGLEDQNPQAGK